MAPKIVGKLEHAIEAGGLAALAIPSIQKLRNKPVDERKAAKIEVGGLAGLAAPSIYHLMKRGSADMDLSAFGSELMEIFEKTAGGFDRAARMLREAKGVASAIPKPSGIKFPASKIRGMPVTGKVMHGLDRGALEPGKLKAVGQKLKAQGAQGV